ncbi:MAG: D-lyxose/D-mannose family sugar isomerase [Spirochaetes bacterium]|nr:MAG: D-lyxose/D-mannose family sugar isomerase [Spirochaetota bacterium]
MKRSTINGYLKEARSFFEDQNFALPPWADWTLDDWKNSKEDCRAIFEGGLGWDLTDFGLEDYENRGLMLFTLRNGNPREPQKIYAEKIMVVGEDQVTLQHFHWDKTEDIINRGGGNLVLELWNSDAREELMDTPVKVMVDGIPRTVSAGESIILKNGESITLTTGMYHRFYGEKGRGRVLTGEVSKTNDDATDNRFYDTLKRFPAIEEDEEPWRLLVSDYAVFLNSGPDGAESGVAGKKGE